MPHPSVATFGAVRGHGRVRETLRAAVAQQRLPHALLFAGPDGVGKRALALALAARLQCTAGGDDACGSCAACRQIAAGSHPDLQLVGVAPGKKEIGVERAREVKRFTQMQPLAGKVKIAIIDDAHMLTVAAQNALLKTLEEPPDRSVLILIANNPDALLPTVRSRCQRLQFSPLPADTVASIVAAQGVDPVAARELAALADGSPGRALALGGSLAGERRAQLLQALAALGTARYPALMQLATDLGRPESDLPVKLDLLLSQYRDAAVQAVENAQTAREALRGADLVHDAREALRRGNPNRQLLLEALLLRLARA
ncbi:MAG TPA: DNA polymerase III subunit delta' [Candidatus Acidoferrales bacterium]|nr:DNA polymerase III subunit delta' [Candidatus Acidoferrales bacterium]